MALLERDYVNDEASNPALQLTDRVKTSFLVLVSDGGEKGIEEFNAILQSCHSQSPVGTEACLTIATTSRVVCFNKIAIIAQVFHYGANSGNWTSSSSNLPLVDAV
jgi:hypothetical protein